MLRILTLCCLCLLLLAANACAVRSISNPEYRSSGNATYRGELHELDVLDVETAALPRANGQVQLKRNQKVLLIQSGAMFPDQEMVDAMSANFQIGTLSGIPRQGDKQSGYRRAAQLSGYDTIVAYWGVLESSRTDNAGKVVSWVPVVGFFIADEQQFMRIRLKLVVVDVGSGEWTMLTPSTADDERSSSLVTRVSSDQEQVQKLKVQAYQIAGQQLAAKLMR